MDARLYKLFHEFGDVFDDHRARAFLRVRRNAAGTKDSLLLVNQALPGMDRCDWISGEDLNLAKCRRELRPNVPIVVCVQTGVAVSCGAMQKTVVGTAAVFETDNAAAFDVDPSHFRRLGQDDARLFDEIENDYAVFDIVAQTKEHLKEPDGAECFGSFEDGALVAFADIAKLHGSVFAQSYALSNIFTVPPFRGKGCATALLRCLLQAYPGKRFYYTASPSTNIASIRLAQKCGFIPVGEKTVYQFT